ncbi:MAG: 1-deoxy-D-xylulose-5-phosphate synthase [Candidatus Gastranaerophilales bacterium]|nr:1-deoxy-D-xylulose-5-phosphate synthase [Candidatus Gastranaerophilales bacterium]
MILDKVNFPKDLRSLNIEEMKTLADEMRELIINKVNTIGGHMAPNLGIVEATIAMHYVFDAPKDKIVFDVSHQCYPHKILTGRKEYFFNPDKYLDITGYTAPEESEYDYFKVGHTSTAASLACGLAKARDLKGENENVIAIVGDGSLSGGEALEGFDNAATLNSNIILVLNDNDMSIAENFGGIYQNLKLLRDTKGQAECNLFKAMGLDYMYVDDGNDLEQMIKAFEKVKNIDHPIVLHIRTLKGKGLKLAEENKEAFHWMMPKTIDNWGKNIPCNEDYNSITKDFILNKAKDDKTVVAINAATPGALGWTKEFREKLDKQYVDVGICEEHAIAFSSALAKSGAKPFFCVLSSFVQRTYDQIMQDLCLNNSPIKMLVFWGGLSSADVTHLGCFDIPLISNIPNMVYLAPTNKEEYLAMLEYSYNETKHPVAIRVPNIPLKSTGINDTTDYSILNKFKVVEQGENIALIGLGNFFDLAKSIKEELKSKFNINTTLLNPKFITGIDETLLNDLKQNHKLVITFEDGQLDGGFGEKISRFYGSSNIKTLNFGGKKEFTDRVDINKIYKINHLTKDLIIEDIKNTLNI